MPRSVPLSTYRLQLTPVFGFDDAAATVPYLRALGITHLYASPFLKARSGSSHGYDVINYGELNPELGGEPAFDRLCDALRRADMGLILDFVPNHMAIHYADNAWWLDVLEWGPSSPHAPAFDIDWDYLPGHPRVLIPVLATPYGQALNDGRIELRFDATEGSFSAWYFEHRLPIAPRCYGEILQTLAAATDADSASFACRLLDMAAKYGPSPSREQASGLKAELGSIAGDGKLMQWGLNAYRPKADRPEAGLALHELLERQHYRLAHWRLAGSEINYRRFFDITTLAGLRVEHDPTFTAVHWLVQQLIGNGRVHGLRIDHVDGLYDPHQYCERLQQLIDAVRPAAEPKSYVVVEKVLAEGERLPPLAGVAGTTGYEWLNLISRLLIDQRGLAALTRTWCEVSGDTRSFAEHLLDAKRDVIANVLSSEFAALVRLIAEIADYNYATRDYAGDRLRAAFELFILHFPVYRTYVSCLGASRADRETIDSALAKARAEWVGADAGIFDFLRDALTLDLVARIPAEKDAARVRCFAFKVQQFTGPMMAKSLEDTAIYRYHRLLALNEVGSDPSTGGLSITDLHARLRDRAAAASQGLTATATHDTKRGEDARARLLSLSEMAQEWEQNVRTWSGLNAHLVGHPDGNRAPSPAHEYMIYQALLGSWPVDGVDTRFARRMVDYAIKAAREGKQETSWLAPNGNYEGALEKFITGILDPARSQRFIDCFNTLARRVALIGALNSLSQLTLKTTMPGVPDFYQGSELWDLSLVDPDNRRPVDFTERVKLLSLIRRVDSWSELAASWPDGRIKLALTHRLLEIREQFSGIFLRGSYEPLKIAGSNRNEIVAFARVSGADAIVVVCGRMFARATDCGRRWPLGRAWDARMQLPGFPEISNLLVGGRRTEEYRWHVSELFDPVPVALLHARRPTLGG
jgi:(1->4)-alpha-D-glucan 1-alpha-D-glucosylmutase